jgi:hypothetical protein
MITVVSGLPRSGTSLMMQMLAAGGLPALTDGVRVSDEDNPRGYFEYEPVKALRSDSSWMPHAEGKAVKVVHLLLTTLPPGFEYRVILMQRPLEQVLASQAVMLSRHGKPPREELHPQMRAAFEAQLAQVVRFLAAQPNFSCLTVPFEGLFREPLRHAGAIQDFLGRPLDTAAMAAAVDASLRRRA